jgi:polyisoprenyl-phosphate glycosyltransferase
VVALSVVVPCFDEEAGLAALFDELKQVLPTVARDFEVVLVDDGSSDRTLPLLREIAAADPRFRYLALSRNFGKESAMLAGLSNARGEAVAIIDADLQHPPQLLAQMVPLLDQGYEQVVARRTRTGDPAVRTALSRTYYRMINRLVDVHLEDGVGDFRVMSRNAVRALLALGEYNRFSKGLFSWIGFTTAVVDYENVSRETGQTKWRMRDLFNYGLDGILSFNTRPLRLAIYFGVLVAAVTFGYAVWVLWDAIVHGNEVPGYVTTICIVVGFGAVQMVLLGIIGEYLGRIYAETKHRPHFLVRESSDPDTAVTVQLGPEREQPHPREAGE